jgi:hypothetical protein
MTARHAGSFLAFAFAFAPAMADDLTGTDQILCTAVQATVCTMDGDCEMGSPWDWNIPQFIHVDLVAKTLRTTPASGQNRQTPIRSVERRDDSIFLHGMESGRAAAVARNGVTVAVFGACTPASSGGRSSAR